MPNPSSPAAPTRTFWIISWLALVWNLIGVATYLMSVTMTPDAVASMPPAEQALYTNIPAWVTSAYAIAVFGGTLASVLMLRRKALAVTGFVVSFAGILVQMGYTLFGSALLEVKGSAAALMPLLIAIIGAYLVYFATQARARGWLG